jgi:hypothetical protein
VTVAGILLSAYLFTGSCLAGVMYYVLHTLLEDQEAGKLGVEDLQGLRRIERQAADYPGGIAGALLVLVLTWPGFLVRVWRDR